MPNRTTTNLICWISSAVLTAAGAAWSLLALTNNYWTASIFGIVAFAIIGLVTFRPKYRGRVAESRGLRWLLMCIIAAMILSALLLLYISEGSHSLEGQMGLVFIWMITTMLGIWVTFAVTVVMTAKALLKRR